MCDSFPFHELNRKKKKKKRERSQKRGKKKHTAENVFTYFHFIRFVFIASPSEPQTQVT